jgi:hypothetical protein
MEDMIYRSFRGSLGKPKKGEKGPHIEAVNFDEFKVVYKDEKMSLAALGALADWCNNTLRARASQLDFLATYHPRSPRFWRIGDEKPNEEKMYVAGLNLEDFIESKSQKKEQIDKLGFFLPDNYELSKKVLSAFGKKSTLSKSIKDISFRDTAMWESKDPLAIKALGNFIQEQYVDPTLKTVLQSIGAKDVKFTNKGGKNKIDFIYV